jgi:signal transduction histidine kinase
MKGLDAATNGWASRTSWRALSRDVALPLVVLVLQLTGAAVTAGSSLLVHPAHLGAVDWALLTAGPAALVVRRRHPVAALWVSFAGTLAPSGSSFGFLSFIVAFFAAASTGNRHSAWLAMALRFVWALWPAPLVYGRAVPPLNDALLLAGWLLVLVIAAEAVRIRTERAVATTAARRIDQRRRESEERLRVARDLHDVIGHNISLINVQASMGLDLMDIQPEQARAALSAIKAASKEALEELRTMLTTLRSEGDIAPRSPVPRLDRLPELVELSKAAGLHVDVEVAGEQVPLPAAVHLAAYRIIQESLTNVARHAGRAGVTVRVTYGDAQLQVEVADDGRVPANGAGVVGTGSGIAGMRERATALGGVLDAGFRPGGGFRVSALLPVRHSS